MLASKIKEILAQAMRAPSGDNCQPWKFEISNDGLIISDWCERGVHFLNNGSHATWLSMGALAESVKIIASGQGLQTKIDAVSRATGEAVIQLKLSKSEEIVADPLVEAVPMRMTYRDRFTSCSSNQEKN